MSQIRRDKITGQEIASEGTQDPNTGVINAPYTGQLYESPASPEQLRAGSQLTPPVPFTTPTTPVIGATIPTTTTPQISPLDQVLKDIQGTFATSSNMEKQMAELERMRESQRQSIEAEYKQQKGESEELGKKEVGRATAMSTRWGGGEPGATAGTAEMGYISEVQKQGEKRIADLGVARQKALASADFATFDRMTQLQEKEEARLDKLRDLQINLITKKYEMETNAKTSQQTFDMNLLKTLTDIPEGKTVNLGGKEYTGMKIEEIDPMYTSASLVEISKNIPIGESVEIQDPKTGQVYKLQGLQSPYEGLNTVKSEDASGNVVLTTYDKGGNVVNQVSAGRIGTPLASTLSGKGTDLTPAQVTKFNTIVNQYQASPLIKANDRAVILRDSIKQLNNDPTNSSLQLSFIYSMIQALDTYQSAVREGELGLIEGTQGLGDKIKNLPDKILKGSILSKEKVMEYIMTGNNLVKSIDNASKNKEKQFYSQAKVSGIGDAWTDYMAGSSEKTTPTTINDVKNDITQFKDTYPGTREELLSDLITENPDVNPDEISRWVYELIK